MPNPDDFTPDRIDGLTLNDLRTYAYWCTDYIKHLTAGADPTPVPEWARRTPGQFIQWFLNLNEEDRLRAARDIQHRIDA